MDDMLETMYDAPGVGLAGPQVGISQRLFVYDDGETGPRFIANPELSLAEGEVVEDEGCLSIPGPFHPDDAIGHHHVSRPGRRRLVVRDEPGRACSPGSSSTRPIT